MSAPLYSKSIENPEALAKYAMGLLERKLYEEHSVKLRLGAELEFTLLPRHDEAVGAQLKAPIAFGLAKYQLVKKGFAPAAHRNQKQDVTFAIDDLQGRAEPTTLLKGVNDPFFPDSPYVAYSYEEDSNRMYESVISHEGRHDKLPPDGRRALTFARSIEALRNSITTADHPHRRLAHDPAHHQHLKTIARDWKPSFDGAISLPAHVHGLHINLSIVGKDGKPYDKCTFLYEITWPISNLMQMFSDGTYLLLHDETSFQRELWRNNEGHLTNQIEAKKLPRADIDDYRIEIARPSANSNPYYATMLTMLGVYRAVALPPAETSIQTHAQTAVDFKNRFFRENNQVTSTLNALESGLGDRFAAAIQAHPPGTEKATVRSR